ncbi:hypothetical protein CVT26_015727 [Gymnopilus dilepis]|uniref:Uncharacterized protein n=1 Tax=Gymnopilus dilepis TaxID=231916 RepID=A0A409VFI3_9AGAR|nr:hypothetical protein CVT26_015727 [Gymnopilus dilepis]
MSLPPLDPTEYGLPELSIPDDADNRSAPRLKRPAAKSRDTEEDLGAVTATVSAIVAVAAQEVRERASPRKRRAGGAKRKRRDADDGDATYPAKRTRIPRGGGGQVVDDDAMEAIASAEGAANISEALSDLNDTLKRRSTRAKPNLKRRDSSSSDTASISPSANGLSKTEAIAPSAMTEANKEKTDATDHLPIEANDDKAEKEEGELSEEQNS